MTAIRSTVTSVMLALALTGCQVVAGGGSDLSTAQLEGRWTVLSLESDALSDDGSAFIEFGEPPRLTGHGGCNRFFGLYEVEQGKLAIEPSLGSTKKACAASVMADEQRLFRLLPKAVQAERTDDVLVLRDAEGRELIRASRSR